MRLEFGGGQDWRMYDSGKFKDVSVEDLMWKTLSEIVVSESNDEIHFYTTDGESYRMLHHQDCCESVEINDIIGSLDDLIGTPIFMAEEISQDGGSSGDWDDSSTWTFYKFATNKGYVTIRWYGSSNGYYSEGVDFEKYVGGVK